MQNTNDEVSFPGQSVYRKSTFTGVLLHLQHGPFILETRRYCLFIASCLFIFIKRLIAENWIDFIRSFFKRNVYSTQFILRVINRFKNKPNNHNQQPPSDFFKNTPN